MDRETIFSMKGAERVEYVNGRLAAGEAYEDILADLGIEKKEAGQAPPYGLGLIKIGNEVRERPGRGDNGFAW